MPNPNIAEAGKATRFTSENRPQGGRPKGSRDAISAAFLADLADIWQRKGKEALEAVATNHPDKLAAIVASLETKRVEHSKTPEEQLADDELEAVYAKLLDRAKAQRNEPAVN